MTWVGKVVPKDQRTVGLEGTAQPHPCCRMGAPPARAAQSPSMSSGTSRDGEPSALGSSATALLPLGLTFLLISNLNLPSFNLKLFLLVLPLSDCKWLVSLLLIRSL